jgi:hypothetical protein
MSSSWIQRRSNDPEARLATELALLGHAPTNCPEYRPNDRWVQAFSSGEKRNLYPERWLGLRAFAESKLGRRNDRAFDTMFDRRALSLIGNDRNDFAGFENLLNRHRNRLLGNLIQGCEPALVDLLKKPRGLLLPEPFGVDWRTP